ncbi:MAG: DnaJ domain-containing protein [Heteroscytonema crispum UTEX LB 1556]
MTENSKTGAAFIAGGTVAGAGVSATVGGIGLAGGFGAVGIGSVPVVGAGTVAGAAAYGAFKAIAEGDATAYGAMGIGAVGGAGISSLVGGMGLVAPKIGLAFGIGTVPIAAAGAVVGLAAYGIAKLLDETGTRETPAQLFDRMEEKVLQMDFYSAAVIELDLFLSGEDLNQKFAALEVEDDLQALKAELQKEAETNSSQFINPETSAPSIKAEVVRLTTQLPETWRCVETLKGHSAAVNAIAISPDGYTLVSGSDDKTVRLWNLKTGKWLYIFAGQAEAVLSVAISPDGRILASGSVDRKITSWKLDTKAFLNTFFYLNSPYSHNGFVYSVAFSPDGKILASGSADNTIRIWGRYTGELKRTLNGHSDAILSVAISPDGKTLVSGSADQTIRLWDLQNSGKSKILTGHLGAVKTVTISPDGQTLISGSTDSTIKLWNLDTGELLCTFTAHSAAIVSLAINPDGKTLASSGTDGIIKLWNLSNGELLQTLSGRSPVTFSLDGKTLVSSGNGGTIKIWRQIQSFHESPLDPVISGEWWEVLGVDKTAHPNDVKLVYRRLARQYHPDINDFVGAKAAMQAINLAYKEFQQKLNAHN